MAGACILACLLAAAPGAAAADAAGRQLYAEPSPLASLIDESTGMPAEARQALADLIIEGLAVAYQAELDQAVRELGQEATDRRRLSSWYQATAPILLELQDMQAALADARQVALYMDRHEQILILIDDRPLLVAWPRVSARHRLERQIATGFCERRECPAEQQVTGPSLRASKPADVAGSWTLSQKRPPAWESTDGVRCEFPDLSARGDKESTCREVVADLHRLAATLGAALRRGEPVEWSHVALREHMTDDRHGIAVNRRGDFILVHVPALASGAIDWREVRRWLQTRVQGGTTVATIRRAVPDG